MKIENLMTEKRNPASMELDTLSTLNILELINDEDRQVAFAVKEKLIDIGRVIDIIQARLRIGGKLIYIGAGTSGRLGVLDASECPPTFGISDDKIIAVIAGGDQALRVALEDAEDNSTQGINDIAKQQVGKLDVVIGIAASGRTPYTIGALKEARNRGAVTACIVCTPDSEMEAITDYPIVIKVGPEVVTGSTRMKAGTAQKMVLNMISTASMVKIGKVYSNLMVDVMASNEKLRKRAKLIVAEAAGVDVESAEEALIKYGTAKEAILGLLTGAEQGEIKYVLQINDGHLRQALDHFMSRLGDEGHSKS
ncbi:N-acetylmuramic acid 6-phosphate etherase [Sporosarcina sp. Te-1]|uniref:N-acetylmuramic acid 6-phosphate etherase n=1 Tax=Sporosarcina sp. Te-1 TaxID=2818390 RepID=UPI001A9E19E9|nr:N-acetylmuramic acid 6-phosphate etherase [Sporosarcina sp. Te-1]QTD41041.1 N-acetylmuramic acid 6-phosphate etherase [Sporosarcina sp. Te-1]